MRCIPPYHTRLVDRHPRVTYSPELVPLCQCGAYTLADALRDKAAGRRTRAMVSDERIAEIRARVDAATPAPWVDDNGYRVRFGEDNKIVCDMKLFDGVGNDSAFVAHARTDVPDLLDALAAALARAEQAEAREQRLREAIERACRFFGVLAHDADRCYQRQRYAESFDDGIPAHWLLQMAASARSAADQTSAALAATATSAGEVEK